MTVLKSKLSGYYFKDFGVWTSDPSEASSFGDEWDARDFVRRHHVDDVQIVPSQAATVKNSADKPATVRPSATSTCR
jgi:hypothetical protein